MEDLNKKKKELAAKLKNKSFESDEEKEDIEKELKSVEDKLKPRYFTVAIDVTIPATVRYKVLASSAEEALEKTKTMLPTETPKLKLNLMKKIKAQVFKYGTYLVELARSF
jgi:hypothetical protein